MSQINKLKVDIDTFSTEKLQDVESLCKIPDNVVENKPDPQTQPGKMIYKV